MRFNRQNFGVIVLALSLIYSALYLSGRFHPMSLRMRARGGIERQTALVLSSLSFKAIVLVTGVILTFWPETRKP